VDPSIFDTVTFYDASGDPAAVGIASEVWNFGDGTTGTGHTAHHQYASDGDGDYTVVLTVTTSDGRTASTTLLVQVRTYDVAYQTPPRRQRPEPVAEAGAIAHPK
jgi:PKD repeat protein